MEKRKDTIIIIEFVFILCVIMFANIIAPDETISLTERRNLKQFPNLNKEQVLSGKFFKELEEYSVDQFIIRDRFKQFKYWFSTKIFMQKDINKMFVENGAIYKIEYPLKEKNVRISKEKIENICEKYLKNNNIYYSIIPDKTYYSSDKNLKMDYNLFDNIFKLKNAKYIDIKGLLNANDFYKTDLHWKQENILKVVNEIKSEMKLNISNEYEEKQLGKFYGAYYGQVAQEVEQDYIKYLTNDIIEKSVVYNYETNEFSKVYDIEKYNKSADKYDVFLSGATSLIEIRNDNASNNNELIIFRDSFGSSLAPFFVENYKKVILIDIRYINSKILSNYINFENQDILFIYSGIILNQNILK